MMAMAGALHNNARSPQGQAGQPTKSPSTPIPPPPNKPPNLLVGKSEKDRALLARAIFRPQEYLAARAMGAPEFKSYKRHEKQCIKGLPAEMLEPRGFQAWLLRISVRGGPCKVHCRVDQKLLEALLRKIQGETSGWHFNTLVPLRSEDARNLVRDLRNLTAYWICERDFARMYMTEPPAGRYGYGGPRGGDADCNGCILAAIGGDLVALEALRISVLTRTTGGGRLIAWLDSWIEAHEIGQLAQIKERSASIGQAIRALRRTAFVSRMKFRKEQRREERSAARNEFLKRAIQCKVPGEYGMDIPKELRQPHSSTDPQGQTIHPGRSAVERAESREQNPPPGVYQFSITYPGLQLHYETTSPSGRVPGLYEGPHENLPKSPSTQAPQVEEYQPIVRQIWPRSQGPTPSFDQRGNRQSPDVDSVQHRGKHHKARSQSNSEYTDLPPEAYEIERRFPSLDIFEGASA